MQRQACLMFALALALWACGSTGAERSDGEPQVGGESHWLTSCEASLACEQGSCLCGVCTLSCDQDSDCALLGQGAVCAPGTDTCAAKTCQLPCDDPQGCAAPSAAWSCEGSQRTTPTAQGQLVTMQLGQEHQGEGCAPLPEADGLYCDQLGGLAEVLLQGGREVYSACFPPLADAQPLPAPTAGALELTEVGGVWRAGGERLSRLVVEANQTALWGQGRAAAPLEAELQLHAPHARVRSLRLQGDVLITERGNKAALAALHIDGDVTIEGRQVALLDVEIHGDLTITAADAVLVNVGVSGLCEMDEASLCDGCYSFEDPDADHEVQLVERGASLCAAP